MRQAQATFDAKFGVGEGVGHRISQYILSFPRSGAHRYTQVQPNRKIRHFGRDAEIQRPRMANPGPRQIPLQPRT